MMPILRDRKPNILVLMADQFRGDCLSIEGHPALMTPNLDHLAYSGARFSHCYSPCPSCIAARRSLLVGQKAATHGLVGFRDCLTWNPPATLPGELTRAGYQTAFVGRTMHQYPRWKRFGFEHMELVFNVTDPSSAPTQWQLDVARAGDTGVYNQFAHGIEPNGWIARPWHLDETLHETHYTVSQAIKWLDRRDPTCPFFLMVSVQAPHPPSVPPAHYLDRYLHMDLPDPVVGDWAQRPANDGLGLASASPVTCLTGERLRLARAGYYASINYIDDQFNRLLGPRGPIDRSELANNTIVVFLSDHGEMLGDHYFFRKTLPYEASARVPLLIRAPGAAPRQVHEQAVSLEDVMPTLLELADVPIPESVEGRSLAPLLRGQAASLDRPFVHGEHAINLDQHDLSNHFLTDGREKYIWFTGDGREQLFDLRDDPNELHDLSAKSQCAERLSQWRRRMIEVLCNRPEGFTDGKQLIAGRPYDAVMPGADPSP